MVALRVYADTSVYGGPFEPEFESASRSFFEQVQQGHFSLVTSVVVRDEISSAPMIVQDHFRTFASQAELVEISPDALHLRQAYLDAGIVTRKSLTDALHVALATIADCPLIVSWNFKHIVHFQKIPLYNAINVVQGYRTIAIHAPQEVLRDEDENF